MIKRLGTLNAAVHFIDLAGGALSFGYCWRRQLKNILG